MPREFRMAAMLRKSTICQALLDYEIFNIPFLSVLFLGV